MQRFACFSLIVEDDVEVFKDALEEIDPIPIISTVNAIEGTEGTSTLRLVGHIK